MTKAKPATMPPCRSTSRAVAAAVPPVASRSSTITHARPLDGVRVHLQRVGAVFERVGLARGFGTAACPACAPARTRRPALGQRRAEDEAARLDADDQLGLVAADALGQQIDRVRNAAPSPMQRRDVPEQDARLGKVGDVADARARCSTRIGWRGSVGLVSRRRKIADRVCAGSCPFRTSKCKCGPVAWPLWPDQRDASARAPTGSPWCTSSTRVVRVDGQQIAGVLHDDQVAVAAHAVARVDDAPSAAAHTGVPSAPAGRCLVRRGRRAGRTATTACRRRASMRARRTAPRRGHRAVSPDGRARESSTSPRLGRRAVRSRQAASAATRYARAGPSPPIRTCPRDRRTSTASPTRS